MMAMERKLSRAEKNAIRSSPCGKCGGVPPFADGTRCHPHRLDPEKGYVEGNVAPRCPECHAKEPEHPKLPLTSFKAGRKGGLKGGRRVHELHPNLARENGRKGGQTAVLLMNEIHRANGWEHQRAAGRRVHELVPDRNRTPEMREAARRGAHVTNHVRRGIVNPDCPYCQTSHG